MVKEVKVDPGDIEDFGRLTRKRVEEWSSQKAAPYRLVTASTKSSDYPQLGEFAEADALSKAYGGGGEGASKLDEAATAFNSLYTLLDSLADATKKIADNYRSTEELNGLGVDQINKILGEEFKDTGESTGSEQPPADGSESPKA